MRHLLVGAAFLLLAAASWAQTPEDRAQDVLDFISGDAGKQRDWSVFESYFMPSAQLYTRFQTEDGTYSVQHLALPDFIKLAGPAYEAGFFEEALHTRSESFNGIATVWQHYRAVMPDGTEEEGINTLQMVQQDGQWKITSLLWVGALKGQKIPEAPFKE